MMKQVYADSDELQRSLRHVFIVYMLTDVP